MTAKEAQNILELEAPFTTVELRSAHKNALLTWFPAQFMSDRAKLAKALEQTALIHEAYDVLVAHCEAEKAAAPNPFVEEALKRAYGQTPDSPVRSESEPSRAPLPLFESQTPALLEPPLREESGLVLPSGSADVPPIQAPAPNPFLHDIVPLKAATEAPKIELRGKVTTPLESPTPVQPRTDTAITKVRPPKVIISPRLRGAAVQPAMPEATVPVPLPPLSAPVPAVAPLPPPPAAPVIMPLVAPEPIEQPVKAEAPAIAPVPVVTPVPAVPEVATEPAPFPVPAETEVAPEPSALTIEPEAKAPEASPAPAEPEVAPEPVAPAVEPPAPVKAEVPVEKPEPELPAAIPAPAPDAEKVDVPEALPAFKTPEPVPTSSPIPPPVSLLVEKPEVPVAEIPPPSSPPVAAASPEPESSAAPATASSTPAEPVHGIPAALAEEVSAAEQASHRMPAAPVVVTSSVAVAHPANHAQAPIARPHPPASANGKNKKDAGAEADEQPAGDHALVPVLGDRYHPAEKELSPNTDTSRHFPTRPVAPSAGTKAMDVAGDAPSSAANRVSESSEATPKATGARHLSMWQRTVRLVCAIVCVGGVGYGIYWVGNSELGRDPWGKKPGSGGPMERVRQVAFEGQKQAAEHGNAKAQFTVAKAYQNGEGVQQNHEEALKWFHKASDQGLVDAQYAIGDAYKNGWGVPADNAEALKWYRKAEATREEQRGLNEKKEEKEEDLRLQ